jgi:hypothetical protein
LADLFAGERGLPMTSMRTREQAQLAQEGSREGAPREGRVEARAARGGGRASGHIGNDRTLGASQPQVLAELAELHELYAAERIGFDEFEQRKHELLTQLHV